jgi:hypothetical protein
MSASINFRELLSQPTDVVERPRPLAVGHYIGEIKSHEFGTSKQKQTPFVRFIMVPSEETSDVAEGANAGIDLSRKEMRKDFYITPASLYRLSDMLDAVLGKQSGVSFDVRIPETRNARVMFKVTQRQNDDGTETYNDVDTIIKHD